MPAYDARVSKSCRIRLPKEIREKIRNDFFDYHIIKESEYYTYINLTFSDEGKYTVDKQNRIRLDSFTLKKAGIADRVRFIEFFGRVEIWSPSEAKKCDNYMAGRKQFEKYRI